MDVILFVGLAVLAAFNWRLAASLNKLEDEVAGLGYRYAERTPEAAATSRPVQSVRPTPARVTRSGSGEGPLTADGSGSTGEPGSPAVRETFATLFERFVGGRLLIWIGGIALAVAGIFLVRYSIEIGLITPELRMIAAALLGLLLLGAGEYARFTRFLADDPRIAQALAGAGIAILYAAAYGSYFLYGLLGVTAASAWMLLITVSALILSIRHGAPTAALGLVGGFLTPALVGDPDAGALPLLLYLGLLDVALFIIAWRRGWTWLAAAAVAASFVWTGIILFWPPADAIAAGIFAIILAVAATLARPGEGREVNLLQPVIIALVQLAFLVGRLDTGLIAWLLFGALAAASLPLAILRPDCRYAPPTALLLALLLLTAKAATGQDPLVPGAAVAITLLFAGGSILSRPLPPALTAWTACGGVAGPFLICRALRPELLGRVAWGGVALLLALAALGLMALQRARLREVGRPDFGALATGGTAALLIALAALDLAPRDYVSAAWLAASIALLVAGSRLGDKALRLAGLGLLTATILKAFLIDAAALEGLLRILSFLGLGVALIGIGKLYTKMLSAESRTG